MNQRIYELTRNDLEVVKSVDAAIVEWNQYLLSHLDSESITDDWDTFREETLAELFDGADNDDLFYDLYADGDGTKNVSDTPTVMNFQNVEDETFWEYMYVPALEIARASNITLVIVE